MVITQGNTKREINMDIIRDVIMEKKCIEIKVEERR